MKELGGTNTPMEMQRWSDWLALDLSADLTYGRDMGQVRDSKPPAVDVQSNEKSVPYADCRII